MIGYIYQIENLITHQSYIGQTTNLEQRKKRHFSRLKNNNHPNQFLQNAWNKYGENEFHFRFWVFENIDENKLNELECEYINKFDSLNNGYNLVPGGGKPPSNKKIKDENIIDFLCVLFKYGDGYGKTFEEIFDWSNGVASTIKRREKYNTAIQQYDLLSDTEKNKRALEVYKSLELETRKNKRAIRQGGCQKAYQLTDEDFFFAFSAQELGYGYTPVAIFIGVKPTTVKDWFNGRSRVKEKQQYNNLTDDKKKYYQDKVKKAHLEAVGQDRLLNKKEQDIIDFLCYDEFYSQKDSSIQQLFNWCKGTCYHIREKHYYPITKAKMNLLTQQQKKERADYLLNRLQSISHSKIAELSGKA